MLLTHLVEVQVSGSFTEADECLKSGIYALETISKISSIQAFVSIDEDGAFDVHILRLKNSAGEPVFIGGKSDFLVTEGDDDYGISSTIIAKLGLSDEFGDSFAVELGQFFVMLVTWFDANEAAMSLGRKYKYAFEDGEIKSRKAGKCYVFRSVAELDIDYPATLTNETLEEAVLSADFDELFEMDVGFLLY
jgi:hypothetical protein